MPPCSDISAFDLGEERRGEPGKAVSGQRQFVADPGLGTDFAESYLMVLSAVNVPAACMIEFAIVRTSLGGNRTPAPEKPLSCLARNQHTRDGGFLRLNRSVS